MGLASAGAALLRYPTGTCWAQRGVGINALEMLECHITIVWLWPQSMGPWKWLLLRSLLLQCLFDMPASFGILQKTLKPGGMMVGSREFGHMG